VPVFLVMGCDMNFTGLGLRYLTALYFWGESLGLGGMASFSHCKLLGCVSTYMRWDVIGMGRSD